MVDFTVLPSFIAVIILFLLPPGQDMAYMFAVGLQGGRRAALKAIFGIGTGMAIYATGAVLGLSAIAESYPQVLVAVRIVGAAYLLWLAYQTVRHSRRTLHSQDGVVGGRWYLRGFLVSVTNPKIILFYLAVLPHFLGTATNSALQMTLLGAVNILSEVVLYGSLGLLAGVFHARFMRASNATFALNLVAATVYCLLAIVIVFDLVVRGAA